MLKPEYSRSSQYHRCWCPGFLRRQGISNIGIGYAAQTYLCLSQRRISATCDISVLRNDRKYKHYYSDVILGAIVFHITSLTIVYSLNRLFRRRSKKTSKLRVTGLCAGNSPVTGEFPAQMASNEENFPSDDVIMIFTFHHINSVWQGRTLLVLKLEYLRQNLVNTLAGDALAHGGCTTRTVAMLLTYAG